MPRRVFITVAERSGDQHAAQLVRSLRALEPDIVVDALGGELLREAGAVVHRNTTDRGAMGLAAALRALEVFKLLRWTRGFYAEHRPDLHICIDSFAMNAHFARLAHKAGVPVLYYIPPQLWASREGRIKKLRKYVDHVACIFTFDEEYFRRKGMAVTYVGHPLFDELPRERAAEAGEKYPARPPVIGLIPGSRRGVASANFPHLLEVAAKIEKEFPAATFLIPTTPVTQPIVESVLAEAASGRRPGPAGAKVRAVSNGFDSVVPKCDLCLTVSGTATLHAAGYGVPMIVVYRGNPILWHLIGRWIIKTRTYSLVNLLSDAHEHIVPEFIPWYGSNDPVAQKAMDYLRHPEKLAAQKKRLLHLIQTLDKPGASENVAKLAMGMMEHPCADSG
ncbi:MAG TPA: hypothetical protein VIL86_01985 [Tepidisphaeraceae bacterium]|jgi:lipid-A-disaccharide synthase